MKSGRFLVTATLFWVGVCSRAQSWKPALTPDGQPDFQAVWNTATLTPLERPAEFAGKEFFTEQEAAAYEKRLLAQSNSDRRDGGPEADLRRNYNEFWRDRGTSVVASRRTSIVVDPPDGKIPSKPDALKRRIAANRSLTASQAAGGGTAPRGPAGPEDLALRIRCISRDLPMIPSPNNNFLQIVQGAGFVAIDQEMMHEWRLIPLTTRPHVDSRIRGYMGDSRGHWEGGTLVIDTANFIGINNFYGADENMHLTERLTRTDPDTLIYRFTVDDPTAFTQPWTGELSFHRSNDPVVEYACHEGNYTMTNILAGARAEETH
ncbi:MAG TPA: hypothetical protein VIY49_01815 [Bryobacteraceae bacterium]